MDLKNQIQKREIKFRAWNTIHNKMSNKAYPFSSDLFIAFDGTVCAEGDSGSLRHPEPYFPSKYEKGKIILMQYTGLKDKNGNEIYEGDILSWESYEGTKNQIRWVVDYEPSRGFKTWSSSKQDEIIIGNIYENPQLLNQQP